MVHTMSSPTERIDGALVRLRRLWSPARRRADARGEVEMSSVLVVEAVARLGAPSVGDVARFADVERSTASRLVDRAVAAGLVAAAPAAGDARRRALRLTPHGEELRREAVAARTAWLRERLEGWPADDVETFARLLERFAGPP
jgi:DNA-binding MarR family transcriptional regulator